MSDFSRHAVIALSLVLAGCSDTIHKRKHPTVQFIQRVSPQSLTEDDYEVLRAVLSHIATENNSQKVVLSDNTLFHPYLSGLDNSVSGLSLDYGLGVDAEELRSAIGMSDIEHSRLKIDDIEILRERASVNVADAATRLDMTLPVYSTTGDAYVFLFERRGYNGGEHLVKLKRHADEWVITEDVTLSFM